MNPQIAYLLNLAIQKIQSKKLQEAELLLKQALKLEPNNTDTLCFMSVVAAQKKDFQEALRLIEKSITAAPKNPIAHSNKGNILKELGKYSDAITCYEKAILLERTFVEPYSNKGNALQALSRFEEALDCYSMAISLEPQFLEAYGNKGNALYQLGRYEEALDMFDQALEKNPRYIEAWRQKGFVLQNIKRYEDAMRCFQQALSIDSQRPESWYFLGLFFFEIKKFSDATACFDKAIAGMPNYAEAWGLKGRIHFELQQYENSIFCYEKAFSINPYLELIAGSLASSMMYGGLWSDLNSKMNFLLEGIKNQKEVITPFALLSLSDSQELHLQAAKIYIANKYASKKVLPKIKKALHSRIRIGYYSADFQYHAVSLLMAELYELHNREDFELFAFSLKKAPDNDPIRTRLKPLFDHFIEVDEKSSLELAQLSRDLEIDIAVDLGGHTENAPTGAMSYRAAPIQINYLGYPGTMGAEYMDYIIADHTLIPPESQQFYTEKVIYLPDTYIVDDSKRVASSRIFTRAECGLPQNQIIFCCFNNSYKFNPTMLKSWASILMQVPNSVFWVSQNNPFFRENLLKEFEVLGIASERIIFANKLESMADHLARLSLADLFLDTAPYNAHTTALDSLKAGVPIITYLGQAFAGRVGASVLNAIELPELITHSLEGYEQLAVALAQDPERLQQLKTRLAHNKNTTALFDTPRFVRNLEDAYRRVYENYQSNEAQSSDFQE